MDKLLSLLDKLVSSGRTKMIVAGVAEYFIWDLTVKDKVPGEWAVVAMVVIALGFFVMRHIEQLNQTGEKK